MDPKAGQTRGTTPPGTLPEQPMSATEARQGSTGRPVLMVLVAGLVLAAVAWGGAEWWGESTAPPAERTATPPAGDNTPANPNATPSANPAAVPPAASGSNGQTGN
ncbi:hypothetical protein EPK99_13225 [Neorhizobium lilium]|uniref:Uncharacterized protein n=1 Tax=Neorhizobium lilium TaxID=2503024 RepID=A0A3S3RGL6_9HYPH|nr:hypothetical protein EPK99_13225 [Neorhizobium lilium]